MSHVRIILDGSGCWPDFVEKHRQGKLHHVDNGLQFAALPGGMASGRPSVAIRIDLPDGSSVMAETSMRAFLGVARAFVARFGEEPTPRGDDA